MNLYLMFASFTKIRFPLPYHLILMLYTEILCNSRFSSRFRNRQRCSVVSTMSLTSSYAASRNFFRATCRYSREENCFSLLLICITRACFRDCLLGGPSTAVEGRWSRRPPHIGRDSSNEKAFLG